MEHDVYGLIMSVDIRVDQIMLEELGADRVFLTEEQPPENAPVAPTWPTEDTPEGTSHGQHPSATGVDHGFLSAGLHKEALPEMLRLRDYIER